MDRDGSTEHGRPGPDESGNDDALCAGLEPLRRFALAVREVLAPNRTRQQAWHLYRKLQADPQYQKHPDSRRALNKLRREQFAKAITYLGWTHRQKIRTNNHVERMNRTIRSMSHISFRMQDCRSDFWTDWIHRYRPHAGYGSGGARMR